MALVSLDTSAASVPTPGSGSTTLFTEAGQGYTKDSTGVVTPLGALSPSGVVAGSYTSANITVDSNGIITVAANGTAGGVSSFNTRDGAITLTSTDVTDALAFTPYSDTNPAGYTTNTGTVTDLTVANANGVSGTVATSTTTPEITLTLGAITPSSISTSGNINLSTMGSLITGNFNDSVAANRVYFQTNVTNQQTVLGIKPNGIGVTTGVSLDNSSTPLNNGVLALRYNSAKAQLISMVRGSGTVLPMEVGIANASAILTGGLSITTAGAITATHTFSAAGNIGVTTAGSGFQVKEGSNAKMGTATLVAGTVTVSTTAVTANSRIFLSVASLGTVTIPTMVAVTALTAGTSFDITSANVVDTSVVNWVIFEPA